MVDKDVAVGPPPAIAADAVTAMIETAMIERMPCTIALVVEGVKPGCDGLALPVGPAPKRPL
jgi:hypothetical protein